MSDITALTPSTVSNSRKRKPAEAQASRDATQEIADRLRRVARSLYLGNSDDLKAALAEAGAISGHAAAIAQVEALTGARDTTVYIRAVKELKDGKKHAFEFSGTMPALVEKCQKLNLEGRNIYIVPQVTPSPKSAFINGGDVRAIRCIFADGDHCEMPKRWHVLPSFTLVHAQTKKWWAFWLVNGVTPDGFPSLQSRLAEEYKSDRQTAYPSCGNRLAGFPRWKELGDGPAYDFIPGTMAKTDAWQHQGPPELPPHAKIKAGDGGDDCVSEVRLRFLLKHIDPECIAADGSSRFSWLGKLGAIKDAEIGRADRTYLDETDKEILADEWSSGVLGGFSPGNYEGFEDVADKMQSLSRNGATTVASLVFAAEAAGMDKEKHAELRRAETTGTKALFQPVKRNAANENGEAVGPAVGLAKPKARFQSYSRGEMNGMKPAKSLINGFIPEKGHVNLVGAFGALKSFIALDAVASVVKGGTKRGLWDSTMILNPGPGLIGLGEGMPRFVKRVRAWEKTHNDGKELDGLVLINLPHVNDLLNGGIEEFIAEAKRHHDSYRLVALDTTGRAMSGVDENKQEHASKFSALVARIIEELDCAVLAVQHSGHGKDAGERARGSSVFGADADTIVRVDRPDPKLLKVELHMMKQKDGAEWAGPKMVAAEEVRFSPDPEDTSLAAVRPAGPFPAASGNPAEAVQNRAEGSPNSPTRNNPFVLQTIDTELARILKGDQTNRWSTRELADALEGCPNIDLSANTIRLKQLPLLKADKSTHAYRCYVRGRLTGGKKAKRWHWVALDGSFWDGDKGVKK